MSTKITRKDAEQYLVKLLDSEYANQIKDSNLAILDRPIAVNNYLEHGKSKSDYYCHKCGNTQIGAASYGYSYYRRVHFECDCGNDNVTASHSCAGNEQLYVKEKENGFEFFIFSLQYNFPDVDDWYKQTPDHEVIIHAVGMFDSENGWNVMTGSVPFNTNHKLLKRDCNAEIDILNKVRSLTPLNIDPTKFSVLLAETNVHDANRVANNEKKRANSKATMVEEMRKLYKASSVSETDLMQHANTVLYANYSNKNGKQTYMVCCTQCGFIEEVDSEIIDRGQYTCPCCGQTRRDDRYYSNNYANGVIVKFENTNLPENDLLIRVFKYNYSFDLKGGLEKKVHEAQRIFCGKRITVYNGNTSKTATTDFSKGSVRDINYELINCRYGNKSSYCSQSDEEIVEIIKNSCLAYSGLVESYGLGDPRYKGWIPAPCVDYITLWYKKPSVELILKSNMINFMNDLTYNNEHVNDGKTLAEALCVHNFVAKLAAKHNLDSRAICDLESLYNADNNLTEEQYLAIRDINVPVYLMVQLQNDFGINYAQTMRYLQSVYDHQCFEKREAIGIWIDYLRMAKALKIDMTDKSRKYPASLKKEHDVAIFAYKAVQVELDKEMFATQAEANTYFEYTYKDLMVIVPKTPEDIVEEATRQKNCLRSYIERVKNGSTVVAFIRYKETPNDTYVTAEVCNGSLIQLKGYCNSNPRNKDLVEFVSHWSKAKGIRIEC